MMPSAIAAAAIVRFPAIASGPLAAVWRTTLPTRPVAPLVLHESTHDIPGETDRSPGTGSRELSALNRAKGEGDDPDHTNRTILSRVAAYVVVISATLGGYTVAAFSLGGGIVRQSGAPYFVWLAAGWLHHHWWIDPAFIHTQMPDLTTFHGHLYVAFPPLPALIMLPFVALFGGSVADVPISLALASLNAVLLYHTLGVLGAWGRTVHTSARRWLVATFAFGSAALFVTIDGSVWFFAQTVALTCLLCGIIVTLRSPQYPRLAALWFGLAGLARPDVWGAAVFYLVIVVGARGRIQSARSPFRTLCNFFGVFLVFPLIQACYNVLRFGSPSDPGYRTMHVSPGLAADLARYGLFNLHYLGRDLYYMFLAPPRLVGGVFQPNPWGMSLLLTTPVLIYAVGAWRGRPTRVIAWAALLASSVIAVPLVTYYNTGWIQFGARFALDFLPFLFILVALGLRKRGAAVLAGLAATSILINVCGTHWYFVH